MYILFPSSYLNSTQVDEEFQKEHDAALNTGLDTLLFNQSIWDNNRKIILNKNIQTDVIYRGWMLKPNDYQIFYQELKQKGVSLLTFPNQYKTLHCFPYVYSYIKEDTPKIMTFPFDTHIDVELIKEQLGTFFIKDYVKSVKNTDFPKYFNTDITQIDFDNYLKQFYHLRGNLFTEGIVTKQYVNLKTYNMKTNEYRVFFLHGQPISICKNSLQTLYTPDVPKELVEKYTDLPSPFYTVDFAELENGEWIIIETGDGGVSGLSEGQNYESFYRAIRILEDKIQNIQTNDILEEIELEKD